ncbi:hypothetical protein D3C78_1858860 [compost metagenome]
MQRLWVIGNGQFQLSALEPVQQIPAERGGKANRKIRMSITDALDQWNRDDLGNGWRGTYGDHTAKGRATADYGATDGL